MSAEHIIFEGNAGDFARRAEEFEGRKVRVIEIMEAAAVSPDDPRLDLSDAGLPGRKARSLEEAEFFRWLSRNKWAGSDLQEMRELNQAMKGKAKF